MAAISQELLESQNLRDGTSAEITRDHWKSLYYFNLYRVALAITLATIAWTGGSAGALASAAPKQFLWVALVYMGFASLNIFTIASGKPRFNLQAPLHIVVDIVALTLLMHASGGVESGVGLLMIVSIAAAGVVLTGRTTLFLAALASFAVLLQHSYSQLTLPDAAGTYTSIGLLGIGLFATALAFYSVANRLRRSEALAAQREVDLENLAHVNELIVQRMESGVLVIDGEQRLRIANDVARNLLGLRTAGNPEPLAELAPALAKQHQRWLRDPGFAPGSFRASHSGYTVVPRFIAVGTERAQGTIAVLEDLSHMERQAQQSKLAALGRLTAGMAHEIRNPLGAISHAGQLLGESITDSAEDRRLISIISDQSQRMNRLVEEVMQLGRRDHLRRTVVDLGPWLTEFRAYFIETQGVADQAVELRAESITACVDQDQLHQVVFNLCQNAIKHSLPRPGKPLVRIGAGIDAERDVPYVDITDFGSGIPLEIADKIFEPFFTTDTEGTGLGLYIARELCEANGGGLELHNTPGDGARFRIHCAQAEECNGAT